MTDKLLIVDDDLETVRLVGLMLEKQGFQILSAVDGPQALNVAKKEIPDLILLDIMMPKMDGYEVARRLRSDDSTNAIPIIMFTAKTQVEDKIAGLEAGADAYLTKPTQPRELVAQVKALLKRSQKDRVLIAPLSEKGHSIGILSPKGGLGVSTLAVNLGIIIHGQTERDTIVAEFRSGQGTIGQDLGFPNPQGLKRLLQKDPREIDSNTVKGELLSHHSEVEFLLASGQPLDYHLNGKVEAHEKVFHQLVYMAGTIIFDLGPSLPVVSQKIVEYCNDIIIVMEPSPMSVEQTKMMINDLYSLGIGESIIHIALINRVRSTIQVSWSEVQEQLDHQISTVITPAPELAYQSSTMKIPIVIQQPDSITTSQIVKLAEYIQERAI
jgi:pilus assembly protein CpaE